MEYKVERADWRKFNNNDWFKLGRICAQGFEDDPLFKNASRSSSYTQHEHKKIREWMRTVEIDSKTAGCDTCVVYNENKELIGVSQWVYPDYMVKELEQKYERVGWWYQLKLWILKKWYWLVNAAEFKFSEGTVFNKQFFKSMHSIEQKFDSIRSNEKSLVEIGDYEKVSKQVYPRDKTVYLTNFCIDREYQGKGVGKLLMNESLSYIPVVEPVFEYNGGNIKGPQKLEIESSDMGKHLYAKFGFEKVIDVEIKDGEDIIHSTLMVKTRDPLRYIYKV